MISQVGFFNHFDVTSALLDKRITKFCKDSDDISAANNQKMWQCDAPDVWSGSLL